MMTRDQAVFLLAIPVAFIGGGLAKTPDEIRAQIFTVVNERGEDVASFASAGGVTGLQIEGSQGTVTLGINSRGEPWLSIVDDSGRRTAGITVSGEQPGMVIQTESGRAGFVLGKDRVSALVHSGDGHTVSLRAHATGADIALSDPDPRVIIATENKAGGIAIFDGAGDTIATMP